MDVLSQSEAITLAQRQQGASEVGNDGTLGTFYMHAKQNNYKTKEQGRAVYDDIPYIKIIIPGDKNQIVDRPANDADKQRYVEAWGRFEAGRSGLAEGTAIERWPYLTPAQIMEMRALGIQTVEQIASTSDANLKLFGMNGRELREQAEQYLQPTDETVVALRSELQQKDQRIKELEVAQGRMERALDALEDRTQSAATAYSEPTAAPTVADLTAQAEPVEADQPARPKRGRPPKHPRPG